MSEQVNTAPENIKTVEFIFPLDGHSFIQHDKEFGVIEENLKNIEFPVTPVEQMNGPNDHGTEKRCASQAILKPPGQLNFKFIPQKFFSEKTGKLNVTILET